MIARKYLYLIALAREKHFGRAAAACHVSPSTLSAAIRDLENELGVAVVERSQHFSGLTPAGQCVLEYANRCAAEASGLRQALASLHDELAGRLKLGVIPTALTAVAGLNAAFHRAHPRVALEVRGLATTQILQQLRQFQLDAGIVYTRSGEEPDLHVLPLWQEEHMLLGPEAMLAEHSPDLPWADAADLPLCLLTDDMQGRRTLDETFAKVGRVARPGMETDSIASLLAHVGTGLWCTILPRRVTEHLGIPLGLRALRLTDPTLAWAIGLVTLRRDPPSPMVAALRQAAESLTAPLQANSHDGA